MDFKKLAENKKFLLILLILNFIGFVGAGITYSNSILKYIHLGKFYWIPFFIVSFWLFFLAFIFVLYLYRGREVPRLLGNLTFVYCFVYGFGSIIFYPLMMIFVGGFSLYRTWNIFAHGFVGLQSLLFLVHLRKIRFRWYLGLIGLFLLKDLVDFLNIGFQYFVNFHFPVVLKQFLFLMIMILQAIAFYLAYRQGKSGNNSNSEDKLKSVDL